MTVWILSIWLCASPGGTGECRPVAEPRFATWGECRIAANAERRASVHIATRCRREPVP